MKRPYIYRIFSEIYHSFHFPPLIRFEGKLILVLLFILIQAQLLAQNATDRAYIISKTNVERLIELSEKHKQAYVQGLAKAGFNTKHLIINKKGQAGYLSGFDKEGKPIYDFDDNRDAAISIKTAKIWEGGASGLNLDGFGIEIGQWEAGGLPLLNHQEFGGRVSHAETEDVTGHATHTACTMIGSGVSNAAHGMASGATIVSRKSDNDESEMAEFAALGGILSNHSYGTNNPDGDSSLYGVYNGNSSEWDEIFYNAPYLFSCKSAGNDRDDGVNIEDGGYDILYTIALSKNLLTVGAVDDVLNYSGPSSVLQSDFCSWGPTDDWRIKPDLTANGVGVFSANNINISNYSYRKGTSMSVATVTGTVALLQQHYYNLNDVYMKAATVKALLLCTTDELGDNDGPDFQSGWGLLNAEKAAYVISNNGSGAILNELSISDGETIPVEIKVDGTMPVQITIAWTDPPGLSGSSHDNLAPVLINDLDLRVSGNGNVYEPWVLTPNATANNFTDAATKGDNFRDNVERIDIDILPAGSYTISISHKGSLVNGSQDFSLAAMGLLKNSLANENQIKLNNSIRIYPIPVKDGELRIEIPDETFSGKYTVEIYDSYGKQLKKEDFYNGQSLLDISNLIPGIYFVRIILDGGIAVRRIVLE